MFQAGAGEIDKYKECNWQKLCKPRYRVWANGWNREIKCLLFRDTRGNIYIKHHNTAKNSLIP